MHLRRHQTDRRLTSHVRRVMALVAISGTLLAGLTALAAPANAAACSSTATAPSTGDGSSGNPYVISSLANLTWLRNEVNNGTTGTSFSGKYLTMDRNIVANCDWTESIGNALSASSSGGPFDGTFDGAGYEIQGLNILQNSSFLYAGLFNATRLGEIKNLRFTGNVTQAGTGGTKYVGGLVGYSTLTSISSVSFTGTTTCGDAGTTSTQCWVGGLIGTTDGSVSDAYAIGAVNANDSGSSNVGGLIGRAEGSVTDVFSHVAVTRINTSSLGNIGGIVGFLWTSGSVNRAYMTGTLTTPAFGDRGGIVGENYSGAGTVSASFWDSTVNAGLTGIGNPASDTGATPESTADLKVYSTYSTDWSPNITDGYSASTTWGICSATNSGFPFLSSFYSTSPCTPASPTPTFDTPVPTADGFTVNVTNYDALYTWTPTVTTGSVSAGTASGSTLPLTVTGLSAGGSATITVTTSRSGYTDAADTVMGTAISNARTPTFDTPTATSGGFTVNVTNYDANYTWTPTVSSGSVSAGTASGSSLPLTVTGLSAGASATITMTTTRTSYNTGTGTVTGTSLVARASASPSSVSFGVVDVGSTSSTQTVTITSSGTSDLVIGSGATSITGADSSMFTIDTDNCSSQTLTPASTCTILVSFTPTSTGEKAATLNLASNDPSSPTTVTLTGGEEPVPQPKVFTFWFDTPAGGTCLDSVRVIDTHIYQLPGADVACVPEGSELVGWSIPGQTWNFAPGAEVVVSGSQTFTAVALSPDVIVTYDSNVSRATKCPFGRKSLVVVPRDGSVAEWTYCTPKGYSLVGWTTSTIDEDAVVFAPGDPLPAEWFVRSTDPVNSIHLYAMWKYVG